MKRKHVIYIAICLLALAGCARKSAALKTSPVPAAVEQIGISTTENGDSETATEVAEAPIAAQPYADGRIDDETDPNVIFHAEVTLPEFPTDRNMPYCEATFFAFDPQKTAEAFRDYLKSADYQETISGERHAYFYDPREAERMLIGLNGNLLFYTEFGSTVDELFEWRKNVFYNADCFEAQDFSFAAREEAAAQVKDMAKALGIDVYEEARVYALSAERMKTAPEWMKEIYPMYEASEDFLKTTEWRDCYYVVLNYAYDGIRLTDIEFGYQSMERQIPGSAVEAVVSEKGIEYMSTSGYCAKEGAETKYNTLIEPEKAVAAVKRIYADLILQDPLVVTDMGLYYMWYNGELVPVYCFRAVQSDWPSWIYIHGFTGERII